jgi:FkbM family methyltransferase
MNKFLCHVCCWFIPGTKNRKSFREKHIKKNKFFELEQKINTAIFKLNTITSAIADGSGNGIIHLMMNNAMVPEKYRFMFYEINDGDIFIDGGANEGIITDLVLKFGAKVYAFEPNPLAINFLRKKYINNKNVVLEETAISDEDGDVVFKFNSIFDQAGTIEITKYKYEKETEQKVKKIKFSNYILNLIKNENKNIYMVKLDIEGAEFDV